MHSDVPKFRNHIHVASGFTWQLTFKVQHLPALGAVSKTPIRGRLTGLLIHCSFSQRHFWVMLRFLYNLQPKQNITTDWIQLHIWISSCLPLSQTLKKFSKMQNNANLSAKYNFFLKVMLSMLTCNGFIIAILKWIKIFLNVCFDLGYDTQYACFLHKQKFF